MATFFPLPSPTLPEFQTLLVMGCVHASAPIHFCLSYVLKHDTAKAVLLTPSRARFTAVLKNYNDDWVNKRGGDGRTCKATSRVDILHPPSPKHVALLLSLFHEALDGREDFLNAKTTFATAPSLIVLCELSSFFVDDPEATVSSYLELLLQALSTVSSLTSRTGKTAALAIFDSGLLDLRLPLMKPVIISEGVDQQETQPSNTRREPIAFLAQRYFEWIATIEEDVVSPAAWQEFAISTVRSCSCHLRRTIDGSADEQHEIFWQWREERSASKGVIFSWS